MFKKVGISLLLALTILVAVINEKQVKAAPVCASIAECLEIQREARDNIAEIIGQEEELTEQMTLLQAEISAKRNEISILEITVSQYERQIAELSDEMEVLGLLMEENLEKLYSINEEIDEILEEMAQRLRWTQRINNTNSFLTVLMEAESLVDFIRVTREINRIANVDAQLIADLDNLIETQADLLAELYAQSEQLEDDKENLDLKIKNLEYEQEVLYNIQLELIEYESQMQAKLDYLHSNRVDEQARLNAARSANNVLSSPNSPAIPNESGFVHPMPGSIVTSEFMDSRRWDNHRGIDLVVVGNVRADIVSVAAGTVVLNEWDTGMGWYVVIEHVVDGQRVATLYGHLRYASPMTIGTSVEQGQVIGTKGNTGISSGAHLHFEVHPGGFSWGANRGVNPRLWFNF